MNYQNALERVQAAQLILSDTSITKAKFEALRKLLKGLNPKLDTALTSCSTHWNKLLAAERSDVVELVVGELPELTPEQKKRKKLLLLFLSSWKNLNKEVVRVRGELEKAQGDKPKQNQMQAWGNILGVAKGPLGIITLVAAGWVLLEATSVDVTVTNRSCDTISPVSYASIPLPGISLPKEPITNGGSGLVKMPPLSLTVDGTKPGLIGLSALKLNYQFSFPAGTTLTFDGKVLNGATTSLNLGGQKHHTLVVICR